MNLNETIKFLKEMQTNESYRSIPLDLEQLTKWMEELKELKKINIELSKLELTIVNKVLSENLETLKMEKAFYRTTKNKNKIKHLEVIIEKITKLDEVK